ncbi:MAG TPA: hypothetical protein DEA88_13305 [Erwinia persicina]|nr:hypothetical protein [Erwinia persicina]
MSGSTKMSIQRRAVVEKVITALNDFFEENNAKNAFPSVLASTRDVANRSELSIYNARHILIRLEKEGVITSIKKEKSKSLFWNKTDNFKL